MPIIAISTGRLRSSGVAEMVVHGLGAGQGARSRSCRWPARSAGRPPTTANSARRPSPTCGRCSRRQAELAHLVDAELTATKCSGRAGRLLASRGDQPLARGAALSMVSWVVKVLLATMNSVERGSRVSSRAPGGRCRGSTRSACAARPAGRTTGARTTILGPRSEPPMPMFSRRGWPRPRSRATARRAPARKGRICARTARTSGITSFRRREGVSWGGAAPGACTARFSLVLILLAGETGARASLWRIGRAGQLDQQVEGAASMRCLENRPAGRRRSGDSWQAVRGLRRTGHAGDGREFLPPGGEFLPGGALGDRRDCNDPFQSTFEASRCIVRGGAAEGRRPGGRQASRRQGVPDRAGVLQDGAVRTRTRPCRPR